MTDARLLGADEATFIAAVRSDDTARFALITERHRRELQVHCYRMLANYEDAQDMTQETFLRAWNKRESFKGQAALRTWLYRIATNACLDFLEKRNDRTPQNGQGGRERDSRCTTRVMSSGRGGLAHHAHTECSRARRWAHATSAAARKAHAGVRIRHRARGGSGAVGAGHRAQGTAASQSPGRGMRSPPQFCGASGSTGFCQS